MLTNNLEYHERVQTYINAGRASVTDQFHHRTIGFNYRLGEFQAALLSAQLESLPDQAKLRMANMAHFEQQLANTPGIGFLKPEPRITTLAPYGFVLKYLQQQVNQIPRAAFVAALQLEGIPCDGLFYEPVYRSSLFPLNPADFPALTWNRPQPLDLKTMYSCPESEKAAYVRGPLVPRTRFFSDRAATSTPLWRRSIRCSRTSSPCGIWTTKQFAISGSPRADRES